MKDLGDRLNLVWRGTQVAIMMVLATLISLMDSSVSGKTNKPNNLIAQILPKPATSRRIPKGRTPSTPRDPDCPLTPDGMPTLTALTPFDDQGVTVSLSQNPTFRFYSPYTSQKYRFKILKSPKSKVPLHTQIVLARSETGVFAVSLPVITAIKPQEYYFWELEYICSNKANANNPIVFGWLYRDRLTNAQALEFHKIEKSDDRIAFYRKYGIWLELLDEIAKLLPTSQTLWQQTLDTEGLQSISKQPILSIQSSPTPIKP